MVPTESRMTRGRGARQLSQRRRTKWPRRPRAFVWNWIKKGGSSGESLNPLLSLAKNIRSHGASEKKFSIHASKLFPKHSRVGRHEP